MDKGDRLFFAFSDNDSTSSLVPHEWFITIFKISALFLVFAISIAGSFLPLRLSSLSDDKRTFITAASRCFAAGVFLGVGLLHMLPESDEGIREAGWGKLPDGREFPLAFGVATLGFVVVWFLERHGEVLWGPEKERMLAVATQAEKSGGGSICYVQVETVASYGPVVCRSGALLPTLPQGGVETLRLPMLPPVSVSEIEVPVQREYVQVPDEPEGFPLITSIAGDRTPDATRGKEHQHSRTGQSQSQTKNFIHDLFQHVQDFSAQKQGGPMRRVSEDTGHTHSGHIHSRPDNKDVEDPRHRSECLSRSCNYFQNSQIAVEAIEVNEESCLHHLRKSLSEPHSSSTHSGLQENVPDNHSHDWGQWSDVRGGSNSDQCSGLHQHIHGAHHHHIVIEGKGAMSIMLAALLSVHSFVVGAALGSSATLNGALSLLIALVAHKGAEAFSVGLQFVREEVPMKKAIGVMLLYCAMTPLGIVVGMATLLVQGPVGALIADLVQAFGAGTVLYVVMHQLAEHGESKNFNGVLDGVLLLMGVFLMFAVTIFS